jgi:hypothetical protein
MTKAAESHLFRIESGPIVSTRYIPTPSLDPRNIEAIEGVDEKTIGYVRCAIDAFGTVHSSLQRLSDAREQVKKDSSKTQANQILIVAAEAGKLMDRSTRAFDSARTRLIDGIRSIDDSLSGPLVTKSDNSLSAEVRAFCRNLPAGEREKFISDAVKRKDLTTLQAVLGGPAYLSGLSPQMQQIHTRQYRELTTPDLVVRLEVMRKALDLIEGRAGLIFTEIEKALGAKWEVIQKLRETQSAAAQALLLINNPAPQS